MAQLHRNLIDGEWVPSVLTPDSALHHNMMM